MTAQLHIVAALSRRGLNEILRVPGASIPGILAPTIFLVGITSVFGAAHALPGYTGDEFATWVVPVGMLQGAGFTGAATGVNLARDIERGWFDRLLLVPAPRTTLLAGLVGSAALRCLLPASVVLLAGLLLGVPFPGLVALALTALLVMGTASCLAFYAISLALRVRTQQAAPLMQMGSFILVLFTTAYAPEDLLQGWLRDVATINPMTYVLEGVRQGFVGDVTWADTWPALLAIAGMLLALGALAVRGMRRTGR
ncbi:MAG TPA: ABC transporter permease [Capillimicrobium sp.]|nr:ABC transporter permease [Capillimicrobium sp.]